MECVAPESAEGATAELSECMPQGQAEETELLDEEETTF